MAWIGLMMGKALNYRRPELWLNKIKSICGDGIEYEAVSNEVLTDNGDWYLFLKDDKWQEHVPSLRKCRFVVSIISDGGKPYLFSNAEIKSFVGGIKSQKEHGDVLAPGDVVLVERGYLEHLYGIVESVRGKKAKVFFSFYIRSFIESMKISDLKKVAKTNFTPSLLGKRQVTMGAQVVFTNNIYR